MPKYKLIQINTADEIQSYKEVILGLWERNLPKLSKDCFNWIYQDNPLGPAKTILAQCVENGEYVGCAAVYPRRLFIRGEKTRAGILINFAIDKKHRVFGPALMIQKEILSTYLNKEFDLIMGYPNKNSDGILKRIGYVLVGDGTYWTKILNWKTKLIRFVKLEIIAAILGAILDCFYRVREIFYARSIKPLFATKIISDLSKDFDLLWEKARKNYTVIGSRDADYLQWRYRGFMNDSYQFFCLYDKQERFCAYVAYKAALGVVNIYDFFAEDVLKTKHILALFILEMRKLKFKSIIMVYIGNAKFGRAFKELSFIRKNSTRAMLIMLGNNLSEQQKSNLLVPQNWHISDGGLDL